MQIVGVYSQKTWYRGRIEQLGQGKQRNMYRVRAIDFGWNQLCALNELCQLPKDLENKRVLCEKYKMADLKPKGKNEGYSVNDRQRGAEWLKQLVNKRVIISSCYKQVNYAGGIMADCMVGDLNLNKAAFKQGHVILVPAIIHGNYVPKKNNPPQNSFNQNRFSNQYNLYTADSNNGAAVDLDYSSYHGSAPFSQKGKSLPPNQQRHPFTKSAEVKKLEKKINEDKKVINELKKTTNLDSGVKDIVRLIEKVKAARGQDEEREAKGNSVLTCLVGVAEVCLL